MSNHKKEARNEAFRLFCQGNNQKQIAAILGVAEKTVGSWRREDAWEEPPKLAEVLREMPVWAVRLVADQAAMREQLQRIETLLTRLAPPA